MKTKLNFRKRRVSGTKADSLVSRNPTSFGWAVSSTAMLIDKDIKLTEIDGTASTTKKGTQPNFRFEVKFDFVAEMCLNIDFFAENGFQFSKLVRSTFHLHFASRNKFFSSTVGKNKSHINVT